MPKKINDDLPVMIDVELGEMKIDDTEQTKAENEQRIKEVQDEAGK